MNVLSIQWNLLYMDMDDEMIIPTTLGPNIQNEGGVHCFYSPESVCGQFYLIVVCSVFGSLV